MYIVTLLCLYMLYMLFYTVVYIYTYIDARMVLCTYSAYVVNLSHPCVYIYAYSTDGSSLSLVAK